MSEIVAGNDGSPESFVPAMRQSAQQPYRVAIRQGGDIYRVGLLLDENRWREANQRSAAYPYAQTRDGRAYQRTVNLLAFNRDWDEWALVLEHQQAIGSGARDHLDCLRRFEDEVQVALGWGCFDIFPPASLGVNLAARVVRASETMLWADYVAMRDMLAGKAPSSLAPPDANMIAQMREFTQTIERFGRNVGGKETITNVALPAFSDIAGDIDQMFSRAAKRDAAERQRARGQVEAILEDDDSFRARWMAARARLQPLIGAIGIEERQGTGGERARAALLSIEQLEALIDMIPALAIEAGLAEAGDLRDGREG